MFKKLIIATAFCIAGCTTFKAKPPCVSMAPPALTEANKLRVVAARPLDDGNVGLIVEGGSMEKFGEWVSQVQAWTVETYEKCKEPLKK